MMPHLVHQLAIERERDRQRSVDAHIAGRSERSRRGHHRVGVRCGYWLICVGCRLVAPDLSAATH
jgi:hypothetical protein